MPFQSASRTHARDDWTTQCRCPGWPVSIRAPRSRTGRPMNSRATSIGAGCFNPRPALSHGATRSDEAVAHRVTWFQSAPRALARGDAVPPAIRLSERPVSIRAPRSRTGRLKHARRLSRTFWFQSAPRALARGDAAKARHDGLRLDVSIRAPRSRTGRPNEIPHSTIFAMFQSAPRALARGDAEVPANHMRINVFQSAPRALARGDPSPCISATWMRLFQSAPRALARGDAPATAPNITLVVFQSAPRALARGDLARAVPGGAQNVSIRAPRSRTGRLWMVAPEASSARFQSAPRALARGDAGPGSSAWNPGCFNPRPALSHGATTSRSAMSMRKKVSIRAPRSRTGRLSWLAA